MPLHSEFDRLRVVLVATRNPLNIGAAARAMSNFGFFRLRVVNPYEVAFREARSAVGAASLLANAEEFHSVAEAVADCTLVVGTSALGRRELQHPVRRLQDGARLIRKRLPSKPVALLFGSEKVGLSNEDLSHCHWLLRIPTREDHRSVNLGQAVAICLYELARDSKAAGPPEKHKPATAGDAERIVAVLLDALCASGYLKPHPAPPGGKSPAVPTGKRSAASGGKRVAAPGGKRSAAPTEDKVRRLIHRLNLSAPDAAVVLGMLRQILWKLRPAKD